jgi:plastocyanin
LAVVSVVATTIVWAACSSSSPTDGGNNGNGNVGAPTDVSLLSGNNQRVITNGRVLAPLVVRVTDEDGDGVSNVTVNWEITTGGGSLSLASSSTNVNGDASVLFTAGNTEGSSTINASVNGVNGSVDFTATAVTPASVTITAGNNQAARASRSLADALEVTVRASDNGPVPGATVIWTVTGGGGNVSSSSDETDVSGVATTEWTLGPSVATNTARAAVDGLQADFTADGTQAVSVTVTMQSIAFVAPGGGDDVTIQLGDTVRWVNQESVQHTVTSTSVPAGGASFDSGLLSLSQTFTFVPGTRGEWVYFCEVHPAQMSNARITVE